MRLQIYGFLLSLLLTLPHHAISQNTLLIGRVVDIHNEPLIGVNVVQKGTTNGTITDLEGEFSFEAAPNATIVFSYIGFRTEEVDRNGKASININVSSG
jgi:hypothetical protein